MLTIGTIIGCRVAGFLPWKLRAEGRLFLSPLLGLAVLLHVIIPFGWLGHGYRQPVCLLIVAVLVLVALWGQRDLTGLLKNILLIAGFSVVATAGLLYPVWWYGVLSLYNDAFTYLVHGQWLQTHGFAEQVIPSGSYPATSQVFIYQAIGARMGASFLFGFVQALVGAPWSYKVYPAMMAIPVVMCGLAVAGTAYSVARRLLLSLLCGAAVGLTLNGFAFGAANGFMPQTWGLAFLVGSLVLTGFLLRTFSATTTKLRHWLPVALLLAASIHCYSEILPFLAATMGLSFLITALFQRRHFGRQCWLAGGVGLICVLLVNLEWLRNIRAIRLSAAVVVGWPVDWPWWGFLWHALGLQTGTRHGEWCLLIWPWLTGIGCVVLLGIVVAGYWRLVGGRRGMWQLLPHLVFLALVVAVFVYFRWVAASPWPHGTGQSFSQFKLSNWVTPCLYCLLAAGLAALGRRSRTVVWSISAIVLGILVLGFIHNILLAEPRTAQLRCETGLAKDPLSAFFRIRQLAADIPTNVPIFLDLGDKPRQMVIYALQDRALASNWSTDCYFNSLPADQQDLSAQPCRWMISMDSPVPPAARRVGNIWLKRCPSTYFAIQAATGGSERESDSTGWWH